MNTIVNYMHFWPVLNDEIKQLNATEAQREAIRKLQEAVKGLSFAGVVFSDLEVKRVEDMLAITVRECGEDLQLVVNGKWFTLAVEEDGYLVLTSSEDKMVKTGYPPTT